MLVVHPVHHNNHQPHGKQPLPRTTVNVVGIPSVTIQNNRLVVGTSQTSSTRSYTPVKVLGDGSFGTVLLCDWHGTLPPNTPLSPMQCGAGARPDWAGMRLVAVKRMKKKWEGGWDECQKLKELQSLRAIPYHPNIIPLYDFFLLPDTKELYFVFESMEGNLYHLIKARKGRPLAGGLVSHIFAQIVEGLHHIHIHGYFHRDMKPENVLVTTTGLFDYTSVSPIAPPNAPKEKDVVAIIKLADFGLARETNSLPPYTEYVSTRWYRAPEVLLFSRDYSNPVDMWALGTIMAELVNLKPLFPGSDQVDQVARICEVLGDPSDGHGLDATGSVIGGGTWLKGEKLAKSIGFQFPRIQPKDFHSLFADTIPRSLVNCIRDLLRYDPDRRLTSQQCREHPYLRETLPRNQIALPANLFAPAPQRSVPPSASHVNGSQSHPSLVTPHIVPPHHSHSAQNLLHQQFPDASSTHRTPYPIPPHLSSNSFPIQHDYRIHPQSNGLPETGSDYPMSSPSEARPHVNGHGAHDTAMVQDPPSLPPQEGIPDLPPAPVHVSKFGKRGLPFGKKHGKWGLGMFSSEKSHPLPPVDETSPAVVFQSRKRSQSDGSDSKSMQQQSPVREQLQDTRDVKKMNKKEAQRLHREAELEKRKMLERNAREQARAVLLKRQQMLRKNVGDDLEWSKAPTEIDQVKQPSSGPVRRDHQNARTVGAAAGKFVMPSVNELPPERDRREREWRGPPAAKARRREFDDDHSMSSSDVHSISRMSSISFATVDSDPGPTRLRNRPSLYGISRMTSRSSLRTSFDDFPPSARTSNSYSYEGQLAHDFRTQACVSSNLPGSLSPPPLQMLSLSPAISPSSPPGLQTHQLNDDLLAQTQSPLFLSISPRFHGSISNPHSPVDANGQLPPLSPSPYDSPYGYTPSSGHTPKSAKSIMNPIFRVSYKWGSSDNLVPDTVHQPPSTGATKLPMLHTHTLPPCSELEAVAGAGEYPQPLRSSIRYTSSEGP